MPTLLLIPLPFPLLFTPPLPTNILLRAASGTVALSLPQVNMPLRPLPRLLPLMLLALVRPDPLDIKRLRNRWLTQLAQLT